MYLSLLAGTAGVALGAALSAWVFLSGLEYFTDRRLEHGWLVFMLPAAGAVIGFVNLRYAGRAARGTPLVMAEAREVGEGVPRLMWLWAVVGSWMTHLVGGSAGREGTAVQMTASLTDGFARKMNPATRQLLLGVSIGAGFAAVFGVPWAGAVFGLEVARDWRSRARLALPVALAAHVAHWLVVAVFDFDHGHFPRFERVPSSLWVDAVVIGAACGIAARLFIRLLRTVAKHSTKWFGGGLRRGVLGGLAVLALVALAGRDYLGLSTELLDRALVGEAFRLDAAVWKLVFTAVTLGFGFIGGEVTPMFVIGSTLGAALAAPLGASASLAAAVGMPAVFAAAARAPLALAVMAAELFGIPLLGPALVGCVAARLVCGKSTIYPTSGGDH